MTRITRFYALDETSSGRHVSLFLRNWMNHSVSVTRWDKQWHVSLFSRKWPNQSVPVRQKVISVSPYCVTGFFSSVTLVLKQLLSRRVTATDNRPISLLLQCCLRLFFWFPMTTTKHINRNNTETSIMSITISSAFTLQYVISNIKVPYGMVTILMSLEGAMSFEWSSSG